MHSFSLSDSTVVEYHYVVTTLHICMCVPFEYILIRCMRVPFVYTHCMLT